MMKYRQWIPAAALLLSSLTLNGQDLQQLFDNPPSESAPWCFWYWMNGAVTKEGITSDLEAMKRIGLEGAYLMPIRDSSRVQFMDDCTLQATDKWWEMVAYSMREADRLGLKMGLHICDGFALAGGPWIKPEESMQKVVYTQTMVEGGYFDSLPLQKPLSNAGYYEDIAVFALPVPSMRKSSDRDCLPQVTLSTGEEAPYLAGGMSFGNPRLKTKQPVWIQYTFDEPFTARSLTVYPSGTNFQALRWTVQTSSDGVEFTEVKTCVPSRRGWQDTDAPATYTLPETTSRHFRFCWTPEGTEPGAEDLDAAKWAPDLAIRRIELNSLPLIDNFEGKTAVVWRLSPRLEEEDLPDELCVHPSQVVELTSHLTADGTLRHVSLDASRSWMLLRMGHTSTGHVNDTGGGAKGLECDKFDAEAVRRQFENWFGATYRHIDHELLHRVLLRMHSDSWECGSQNWSRNFESEFKARRGYDLHVWLPLYAGIPMQSVRVSESVLHDVRLTIAELVNDVFFKTLHELSQAYGCEFSSECVAPTMLSDGLLHYSQVERPMGEFWYDSPTHDKPNDMFDAVSGAHIYGKNIVQAEGFTQLRGLWKECPGMLKALGDRNLALGMNKLFFHVFCHHPFPGKYPGMTLDGIGLYMQGNQTWWPYASEWIDYFKRCQALLQFGQPVTDVAVFTGENLPSRSVLPDKLVNSLPGLFGEERVQSEQLRRANAGQPMHVTSVGVKASANMVTADLWTDPLRGYRYDAVNRDALLRLSRVENGRMVLPGGASYATVVFPEPHPMAPDALYMSPELLQKIDELQQGGVQVLLPVIRPKYPVSFSSFSSVADTSFSALVKKVWQKAEADRSLLPLSDSRLAVLPDLQFFDEEGRLLDDIAWNHRSNGTDHVWFVSNQSGTPRHVRALLRSASDTSLECWNPLNGERRRLVSADSEGRRAFELSLEADGSCFLVQRSSASAASPSQQPLLSYGTPLNDLPCKVNRWNILFETTGRVFSGLTALPDWRTMAGLSEKYYSGTAVYSTCLTCKRPKEARKIYLELHDVHVIAQVEVNGTDCGVVWTVPYRVEVTDALKNGRNEIRIRVANTWYNYTQAVNYGLVSDEAYWTNARKWDYKEGRELQTSDLEPSGLLGGLSLLTE